MPPPIIRERTSSDLPACASVLARVYAKSGYPVQGVEDAIPFLTGPSTLKAWVSTVSPSPSEVIGHVAMSSPDLSDPAVKLWYKQHGQNDEPIAVLERLFVDPAAQGRGVAAALIRAVVEEGRERGWRLVLFALVKDAGAMRLYEMLGWEVFGRDTYHFGEGKQENMEAVCYVSPK